MPNIRPATHAGSWYSSDAKRLSSQLSKFFKDASQLKHGYQCDANDTISGPVPGARLLIGPHAGFKYSGSRLAETYTVWDTNSTSTPTKRVFILGPSHHVYFTQSAKISQYDAYETPLGDLVVDGATNAQLAQVVSKRSGRKVFEYMDEETDDDEHSFEMHAPFIYHRAASSPNTPLPSIVPIMLGQHDLDTMLDISEALKPYLLDPLNTFVISSDFCHWGKRFQYTRYVDHDILDEPLEKIKLTKLGLTSSVDSSQFPIFKSIESLDKKAMQVASSGDVTQWVDYINRTHNTICGQRPITVLLALLSQLDGVYTGTQAFNWIGYSQSNQATSVSDSSVSYASGYVKLA